MSALETLKYRLQQKPNSRERLIFFVAMAAFLFGFVKACAMESSKSVSSLQERLDKALAEQAQLGVAPSPLTATAAHPSKSDLSSVKWVGDKQAVNLSSDRLVQAARDNGIIIRKISLPDFKTKGNFLYKPISLTLAGSMGDLGRYIETSERLQVPLVIENISLEHSTEFEDLLTLRIEGGFYAEK